MGESPSKVFDHPVIPEPAQNKVLAVSSLGTALSVFNTAAVNPVEFPSEISKFSVLVSVCFPNPTHFNVIQSQCFALQNNTDTKF